MPPSPPRPRSLPGAGGSRRRYVAGRVLYNLGRVTTYAGLGAAAGALGQGLRLAGSGIGVGMLAAFLLTRLMQSLLYQVRPSDPLTFGVVTVALLVVALLASALPAYLAMRVSPLVALRTE